MPEIAHGSASTSRNPRDTASRRTQVPPGFERIETPQVGTHVTGGLTLNTPVAVGLSHGLLLYDIIQETIFLIKFLISNHNQSNHLVHPSPDATHHLVQPTANHLVQTVPVAAVGQAVQPVPQLQMSPAHPIPTQPIPSQPISMQFANYSQSTPRAQPLAQFQQQTLAGHVPLMLANDTLARPYHSRVQYIQGTSPSFIKSFGRFCCL